MVKARRAKRRTPSGLWVAIVVVVGLLAMMAGAALIVPLVPPPDRAAAHTPVPAVSDLPSDPQLVGLVTLTDCTKNSDGSAWLAAGQATNHAEKKRTVTVTVFFYDGDQAVAYAQSRVLVPAQETATWVATKKFDSGNHVLSCKIVAVS